MAGALAWVLLVIWLLGRVASDRFEWTQWSTWIPSVALLAPAWVLALAARAAVGGKRRGWTLAGALILGTAHLLVAELGVVRAVLTPKRSGPCARVVYFNQSGREAVSLERAVLGLDPAILVLANRHSRTSTRDIAQAFIDTGEAHGVPGWPFDVFSRYPIVRWGGTDLGLDDPPSEAGDDRYDPGWAHFYEFEAVGGHLVVWALDLPSDPDRGRWEMANRAGGTIAAWRGRAMRFDESGQKVFEDHDSAFPAPDVIVGDLNIPRGSRSVGRLLDLAGVRAREAFRACGWGWQATWPRERPVLAIDQCLTTEGVRPVRHRTVDLGFGAHRALAVDLEW